MIIHQRDAALHVRKKECVKRKLDMRNTAIENKNGFDFAKSSTASSCFNYFGSKFVAFYLNISF